MSPAKKTRYVTFPRASAAKTQLRPERQLRSIAGEIFSIAKSLGLAEVEVHVDEVIDALTRFANNAIHQHVAEHCLTVSLRVLVDGRSARVSTNRTEEDSLRAALESAASLAASQPKAAGPLRLPAAQKYRPVRRFFPPTAALSAGARARAVKNACALAEKNGQIAAGIFSSGQSQSVLANSRGLFAFYRQTQAEFSVTMQQGSATSWAKANSADFRAFEPLSLSKIASEKAARAENPVELAPGRYTVILEPAAVLDLVGFLFYDFSATAVHDQRSCFSGRLGKPLLGRNISITDDVYHPEQLGAPFDGEGIPRQRVTLVDAGVPRNLVYSRGSAKKAGKLPTGHGFALPSEYGEAPMNLVISGGKNSVPEMISSTDRGLLVTRLWYIREVDPYEKIMTGMTRDGLFLVEKGKVTRAVRNFRFNQSILQMLGNVQDLGPAHRATAEESFEMVIPPMKISNFHFSEVTKF